ncbi:hypothetical protein J3A78_007499 [Streptomyces sp. PvR006]|uniref:hypothetical protein n=1 Tax=Streptomyces sp. NPDC090301 TaxID=3154975 RepID=UPI001FD913C6|nr:hypothetical protein [Streptomyces sp. PvR006]MBP2587021.1 hypothetical protein [Streptomyces sp. PvR006]
MTVGTRPGAVTPGPERGTGGCPDAARPVRAHRPLLDQREGRRLDPAPDFVAAGLQGTGSHGFLTSAYVDGLDFLDDLGLIVVNDGEVGVFRSFGAY